MQNLCASPQMQMSLQEILSENVRLTEENYDLKRDNELQRGQIANLANINVFAANIVNLTCTTTKAPLSLRAKKIIQDFVSDARKLILSAGCDMIHVARRIRDMVIKMCNFVVDHVGEIAIASVLIPAIVLCVGVAGMAIGMATGSLQAVPLMGTDLSNFQAAASTLPTF